MKEHLEKRKSRVNSDAGRKSDFKLIYDKFFLRLIAYARSITGFDELAKDVVADVFLSLWKSSTDLTCIQNVEAYLFSSTKRQCVTSLNKEKRVFEIDWLVHSKMSNSRNPEEIILTKESLEIINASINNLPQHAQLVFRLIKEKGLTYEEVANELTLSKNTVRNHLYRAINQIRKDLEIYFNENIEFSSYSVPS